MNRFDRNTRNKFGSVPRFQRIIHHCKCDVSLCNIDEECKNECLEIEVLNNTPVQEEEYKENIIYILEEVSEELKKIVEEEVEVLEPVTEVLNEEPVIIEEPEPEIKPEPEPEPEPIKEPDFKGESTQEEEVTEETEDIDDNATVSTDWVDEVREEVVQTVVKTVVKVRKPRVTKLSKLKSLFTS